MDEKHPQPSWSVYSPHWSKLAATCHHPACTTNKDESQLAGVVPKLSDKIGLNGNF